MATPRKTRAARTRRLDGGHPEFYDTFYRGAGFVYDEDRERAFVRDVLIPAAGWQPGDRVIEIGAGKCLHAELLRREGMDITAVDVCLAGVEAAAVTYPELDVQCADAARWETDRPGSVYMRGLSWHHYELAAGKNSKGVDVRGCTRRVFRELVAPGGALVLQIVTDLTGRRPTDGRVHQNQVDDYMGLLAPLGETTVVDWAGQPIVPGRRHNRGVICVTRKPV